METTISTENGTAAKASTGPLQTKQDGDDTEDEDDGRDSTMADLCSAAHEFEWLTSPPYHPEKQPSDPQQDDLQHSCHASPSRSVHNRPLKSPWHNRTSLSPEIHACRRHFSPIRSSWCCPSPPPPHAICVHHGLSMEVLPPFNCCAGAESSYFNCSCLPPRHPSAESSHAWCRNTLPHASELTRRDASPCAMSRRSRSTSCSRKRDCSPSVLSPRYSPVPSDQAFASSRLTATEQWQLPVPAEEMNGIQKVQDLESDKKNLILQSSVLADQVDLQADKINELERLLLHKKENLMQLEQNLHQEVLARSSVENSKLELMTELSNLRLRLTAAERDRKESDEKCRKLENELVNFQGHLTDRESEHAILKEKLSRNGNSGLEKLKSALDSVLTIEEKGSDVDDLCASLTRYKNLQDIVQACHNRVAVLSAQEQAAPNNDLMSQSLNSDVFRRIGFEQHLAHSSQTLPSPASSPFHQLSPKALSAASSAFHKSNSAENISPQTMVLVANSQYGTMPRQTSTQVMQQLQFRLKDYRTNGDSVSRTSTLKQTDSKQGQFLEPALKNGKAIQKMTGVSFAAEDALSLHQAEKGKREFGVPSTPQPYFIKSDKDKKGFLKFFTKWKKTGSQNIDRVEDGFTRGGVRATAGPRLGWSRDIVQDPDIPFSNWNTDLVVEWLHKLGLSMYVGECKRWMCNGEALIKATSNELEKELGVKNPLHKKKLLLAVKSMNSDLTNLPASINGMDYNWVVRWLDDVGLPQYKDSFAEARVDGRVLHYLTVDDLLYLKVTCHLHHISIKRGIQALRERAFDPHCLIRRSLPDESTSYTPDLVKLWTNHRVMEWLRTVDLSEYAPNLRGSGVHGALIVYEPKFNTHLFATLLNIPPTKTLLRRHLATHFKHIVGDELTQTKREKEAEAPLSPSVKIKAVRKSQFPLKKKRNKADLDNEDYLCPLDVPVEMNLPPKAPEVEKLVVRRNSDPSPQTEQNHLDNKILTSDKNEAAKDVSIFSTALQDENLNEANTTIV